MAAADQEVAMQQRQMAAEVGNTDARNPVEVDSLSHYIQAFIHVRWGLEMTRAGSDQGLWPHPPKLYHP